MANVTDKVAIIRNATYGNEVREGIASGIENINTEVISTTGKQEVLETVFDGLVINAGSDNAEIIVARGMEDSLPIRLNKFDSSLADVVQVNVKDYWINGYANWSLAFVNALATGKRVFVPAGEYEMGGNVLSLLNNAKLEGLPPVFNGTIFGIGTIIKNGRINITDVKHVQIRGIGISNTDNNGFDIHGDSEDIVIENCVTKVLNHGYLLESSGGITKDIKVINCFAYNSIHGFVSKAESVEFINCKAYNMSANGFVLVSDNINGVGSPSICYNNNLINCSAYNCNINLNIYGRDYTSETNLAGIVPPTNINIIGGNLCDSLTSAGIIIGDYGNYVGTGKTYLDPTNISILGVNITGNATDGINLRRCKDIIIEGCNFYDNPNGAINRGLDARSVKIGKNNYGNKTPGTALNYWNLAMNSTNPSIADGDDYFKTSNTSTTYIIHFSGGTAGKIINILIDDDFSSILVSGNIKIKRKLSGKGAFIKLRLNDDLLTWSELSRSDVSYYQANYPTGSSSINWQLGSTQMAQATGTITAFTFSGATKQGEILTLMLWGGSPYAISGWDSAIKWIIQPTTILVGKRIMMQFFYDGTYFWEISHQECTI